jgi:hypothetical protein
MLHTYPEVHRVLPLHLMPTQSGEQMLLNAMRMMALVGHKCCRYIALFWPHLASSSATSGQLLCHNRRSAVTRGRHLQATS